MLKSFKNITMENEKKEKSGFFANILSALFGGNDSEAEKKRQLKSIAKKLSKSKFNKFYKYSGNEMLPAMGKLFFDIYKSIAPVQNLFNSIQNQNTLKHLVINFSMPEEIRALEDSLNKQVITGMSKQIPLDHLKIQVEEKLSKLNDFFTVEKISAMTLPSGSGTQGNLNVRLLFFPKKIRQADPRK